MDGVLDSQDVSCSLAKALPLRSVEIVLHVKAKTRFFRNTSSMPPKMVKCVVLHSRVALADTVKVPSPDHLAVSSFQNAHLAAGSDTSKVKCNGLTKSLTSTLLPSALQKLMLTALDDKTAAFPTTASVSRLLLSDEGSATALSSRGSLVSTLAVARISVRVPAATATSPAKALAGPPGTRIRRGVSRSLSCTRATFTGPNSEATVTSMTGGPLGGVVVPLLVRFNSGKASSTALSSILLTLATASSASCLRSASRVLASSAEILAKVVVAVAVLLVVLVEDEDKLVDVVVLLVAVELVRVADVDELVKVLDVVEDIVVLVLVADVDEVVLVVDVLVKVLVDVVLEVVLEVVVDEVVVVVDVLVEELVDVVLVDVVLVLLLVVVVDESVTVVDVVVDALVDVLVVVVDDTVAVVEVLVDVLVDDVLVVLLVVLVLLLVVEVDVVEDVLLEDVLVEDVLELLTVAVDDEVVMLVTVPVELLVEVGNENLAATMSYIPR